MARHRNSTDQASFQALMNANLIGFGLQRRWWPFVLTGRKRSICHYVGTELASPSASIKSDMAPSQAARTRNATPTQAR